MKPFFTTAVLLLSAFVSGFAQTPTWQWGRRGGTNTLNENEYIADIATDPNGNVYILSSIKYTNGGTFDVAGNAIVGKGFYDVILTSFTCTGAYRWSKVFGGTGADVPVHLATDTLGGVYFTGRFNNLNASIELSSDTILSAQSARSIYLVKYDTAGNYKWVVRPQSDTTKNTDYSNSRGLQVDGGGNVYWLAHLLPNSYGNGAYQINGFSLHVLKYNKNGVFQGGIPMDIVSNSFPFYYQKLFFTRNHKNGKMFISGYGDPAPSVSMSFGSTNITNAMFLGAFSSNGTSLWTKQNNFTGNGRFLDKVSLDDSGNLYLAGNSLSGDAFAGSNTFTNPNTNTSGLAVAFKLDSAGNLKWANSSQNLGTVSESRGTYVNGHFVLSGGFGAKVKWTGFNDSVTKITGAGDLGLYTTRFNAATGLLMFFDKLNSINFTNTTPDVAHADLKGNVYFGGQMNNGIVVAGDSLKAAGSTRSDFFLAKYGYANCNCVAPTASIAQSNYDNATRSVNFQYTGTTVGIDSIVFTWGNGQRLRLTNNYNGVITRYYGTDTGTYNVCVTAYTNGCGNNTACTTVQFTPLGVEQLGAAGGTTMTLAPNPATNAVQVAYSLLGSAGSLEVYDLAGRLLNTKALTQKSGSETVQLTDFALGVYVVILRVEGRVMQQQRLVVSR